MLFRRVLSYRNCTLVIAAIVTLAAPGGLCAAIIEVGASRTYTTIAAGYAAAAAGDTLRIDDGIYTFASTFHVSKSLTFQAANVGGAVITGGTGGPDDALFFLHSDATFIGLHLTGSHQALYQRNTGARGTGRNLIFSNLDSAVGINNGFGQSGEFDISNSTFDQVGTAAIINDGGTIRVTNSILSSVSVAYTAHANIDIVPSHNLLHNVTFVTGVSPSGHVQVDPFQIVADPLFVNGPAGDYRLAFGSLAIDSGLDIGQPFLGAAPDRGAFEFAPAGPPPVPTPEPATLVVFGALSLTAVAGARGANRRRECPFGKRV